jgi:hypothetical protein
MKPAWDKLMKEYEGHKSALVLTSTAQPAANPFAIPTESVASLPSNTVIQTTSRITREVVTSMQ